RRRGHLQHTVEPAVPRAATSKQRWISAADRELQAETFAAYSKMKEPIALAAGLPTIFQDREDVGGGGLARPRWGGGRISSGVTRSSIVSHPSRRQHRQR